MSAIGLSRYQKMLYILLAWGFVLLIYPPTRLFSPILFVAAIALLIARQKRSRADCERQVQAALQRLRPDSSWSDVRQAVFLQKGRRCSRCGDIRNLQIHHILPLSLGGTNSIDNLEVVCTDCHERLHGREFHTKDDDFDSEHEVRDVGRDYGQNPTLKNRKAEIIFDAISRKKEITFEYRKWHEQQFQPRHVTPLKIYQDKGAAYLRAFCHSRKAERNFRLGRMKSLQIIE